MILYYGDGADEIGLPFARTEDISFTPRFSEDSADHLFTEKSATVSCVLTADIPGLLRPGETIHTAVRRILHVLEVPRRPWRVVVGGVTLVSATAASDMNNGPKAEAVTITEIPGASAYHVRFRCVTWQAECPGSTGGPGYLSHRWGERVDIGDDQRTTRTRTGRLHVRPGRGDRPDDYRDIVTPPLPPDFLRESSYEITSDGLQMAYTIRDTEHYALPPWPAVKAEGDRVVVGDKGIWRYAECSVRLTGNVKTRKDLLVATALQVALDSLEKIGLYRTASGTGREPKPLLNATVRDKLYANAVEVRLHGLLNPPKPGQGLLKTLVNSLNPANVAAALLPGAGKQQGAPLGPSAGTLVPNSDKAGAKPSNPNVKPLPKAVDVGAFRDKPFGSDGTLGGDPAYSPNPGLRGTAALSLVAAALSDPCLAAAVSTLSTGPLPPTPAPLPPETAEMRGRPSDTVSEMRGGPQLQNPAVVNPTSYSPAAVSIVQSLTALEAVPPAYLSGGVYTTYKLRLYVEEETGYLVLPSTKAGSPGKRVRTHNATKRLVCEWTAERAGQEPDAPPKDLGDPNAVLIQARYGSVIDSLGDDGVTPVIIAAGRYVYDFLAPDAAKIGTGIPPYICELMGLAPAAVIYDGPRMLDVEGVSTLTTNGATGVPAESPGIKALQNWLANGGKN